MPRAPDCSVRCLLPDDAAAYVALRREMLDDSPWAFASSPEDDRGLDPAGVAARLAEPGHIIVGAFDGGARLIGAAGLIRSGKRKMDHRAQVWGVYVTPRARGRGVGGAVLRRVIEEARNWPRVTSLGLSASVRSPEAIRLYERVGFVAWGTEPGALILDGVAHDEVHMVARIA